MSVSGPTPYRIELRGRLSDDILTPYSEEFVVSRTSHSTVLLGNIRDPAHLHGVVAHLTSLGLELLSTGVARPAAPPGS